MRTGPMTTSSLAATAVYRVGGEACGSVLACRGKQNEGRNDETSGTDPDSARLTPESRQGRAKEGLARRCGSQTRAERSVGDDCEEGQMWRPVFGLAGEDEVANVGLMLRRLLLTAGAVR
ncbi:hypothetical protein FQN52_002105 [Onygenales sp. PD_12]|nr:hypothetical protein FQN52_002105 [Onygenales sp. PD_12]